MFKSDVIQERAILDLTWPRWEIRTKLGEKRDELDTFCDWSFSESFVPALRHCLEMSREQRLRPSVHRNSIFFLHQRSIASHRRRSQSYLLICPHRGKEVIKHTNHARSPLTVLQVEIWVCNIQDDTEQAFEASQSADGC